MKTSISANEDWNISTPLSIPNLYNFQEFEFIGASQLKVSGYHGHEFPILHNAFSIMQNGNLNL